VFGGTESRYVAPLESGGVSLPIFSALELKSIEQTQGETAARNAWKAAAEDQQAIQRMESAGLWAAIREEHGGLLRTPYGVIVANLDLIEQVFKNNEDFSVSGHRARMKLSFGDIFIGKDAARADGDEYRNEAGPIPKALSELPPCQVFEIAKNAAELKFNDLINMAKEVAADNAFVEYETTFDMRELLDEVLAELTERWFGIQDSLYFKRSGGDPNWSEGPPNSPSIPLYPGHFAAPSRYMFQPNPGDTPTSVGQSHGKALKRAMLSFVEPYYTNNQFPQAADYKDAPVAKVVLEHTRARTLAPEAALDFAASTMVGIIMGYTPTIYGSVLNVLTEWSNSGTLFQKRNEWKAGAAMDLDAAELLMRDALEQALQMRPMPQITWRTARTKMRLGAGGSHAIDIYPGDKIVLPIVSGTQEALSEGREDGRIMFGGVREEKDAPTHACPGFNQGIAAALGCLAALVCTEEALRPGANPHSFEVRGRLRLPTLPGQSGHRESVEIAVPIDEKGAVYCWGDSWFSLDTINGREDIQGQLARIGYIAPNTYCQDLKWMYLENMAKAHAAEQFMTDVVKDAASLRLIPKAILLSGGGNDSVKGRLYPKPDVRASPRAPGDQPRVAERFLLNPKSANSKPINDRNLCLHLEYMRMQYTQIIEKLNKKLTEKNWRTPIIVHGYAHPRPLKRGILDYGYSWIRGPFTFAGYVDSNNNCDTQVALEAMQELIDRLNNEVFVELAKKFPQRVLYVDLRPVATKADDWSDDLHLTSEKFFDAACLIDAAIVKFWGSVHA
jgi:hypothetical protein